jgi:hypothetical protein
VYLPVGMKYTYWLVWCQEIILGKLCDPKQDQAIGESIK